MRRSAGDAGIQFGAVAADVEYGETLRHSFATHLLEAGVELTVAHICSGTAASPAPRRICTCVRSAWPNSRVRSSN